MPAGEECNEGEKQDHPRFQFYDSVCVFESVNYTYRLMYLFRIILFCSLKYIEREGQRRKENFQERDTTCNNITNASST